MLSIFCYEVRAAFRSLKRSCGFLAIATLLLALGIGINTTVLKVAMAVLFPARAGPGSEEPVNVYDRDSEDGRLPSISYPDYWFYRDNAGVFSDLAAHIRRPIRVSIDGRPERALLELVSGNYLSTFQISRVFG